MQRDGKGDCSGRLAQCERKEYKLPYDRLLQCQLNKFRMRFEGGGVGGDVQVARVNIASAVQFREFRQDLATPTPTLTMYSLPLDHVQVFVCANNAHQAACSWPSDTVVQNAALHTHEGCRGLRLTQQFPVILGCDFAGEGSKPGGDAERFRKGDGVIGAIIRGLKAIGGDVNSCFDGSQCIRTGTV